MLTSTFLMNAHLFIITSLRKISKYFQLSNFYYNSFYFCWNQIVHFVFILSLVMFLEDYEIHKAQINAQYIKAFLLLRRVLLQAESTIHQLQRFLLINFLSISISRRLLIPQTIALYYFLSIGKVLRICRSGMFVHSLFSSNARK